MAITIWRLVTTAAFITSRSTLRFKWTASVRFRLSALSPLLPPCTLLLLLPLLLLLLSALLARCRFSRIATWLVPFANLYAGHDNSLSYPAAGTGLSLSSVCAVFNPSLQLSLFMWPETRRLCLAWHGLPCLTGALQLECARFVPALL